MHIATGCDREREKLAWALCFSAIWLLDILPRCVSKPTSGSSGFALLAFASFSSSGLCLELKVLNLTLNLYLYLW